MIPIEEFRRPGNEVMALRELADAIERLRPDFYDDVDMLRRAALRIEHPPTPQLAATAFDVPDRYGIPQKVVPLYVAAEFEHLAQLTFVDDVKLAAENQVLQVESKWLKEENTVLRALLPKLGNPCAYCGLTDIDKCVHGFPGCAQADDILCGEDEMMRQQLEEKRTLEAVLHAEHAALRLAQLDARLSVESATKFEEQAFLMRELCGYLIRVGAHPLPAYPRYCRTLQYIRTTNARDTDD